MQRKSALVVDDSKSARFALRKYLEQHHFEVQTAESADEAFKLLQQCAPSVIFLDHVMPGIEGFSVLDQLKADPQIGGIPVVICSSNEGPAFSDEARAHGAADVLQKPPSPEQLLRILTHLQAFTAQLRNLADETPAGPREAVSPERVAAQKVSNIRQPAVAIEQAVMKTLKAAMPPPPAGAERRVTPLLDRPAEPAATRAMEALSQGIWGLREQLEARLTALTEPLAAELVEVKAQLSAVATASAEVSIDVAALEPELTPWLESRRSVWLAPIHDDLAALQGQIDALDTRLSTQMNDVRDLLERMLADQSRLIGELEQQMRLAAADEAHHVAERAVMAAATRISEQMAESILQALGQTASR